MKAWHDSVDEWVLQRIKNYSAFNDPESKNLMLQTLYEATVMNIAEKFAGLFGMSISKDDAERFIENLKGGK